MKMIKNSMVPLYQQLSDEIRRQITDGKLQTGDRLPTEAELSQEFAVSRITVRKAIELLVDDGIVVRRQGIGTFVAQKKVHRVIRNQAVSFTDMSLLSGQEPSAELISVEKIMPDASIASHLHIGEEEQVLKLVRLRKNDGKPVMIEENYYPKKMFFLLQENLLGSTYEIFRNRDYIPTHFLKTVEICYATADEARYLEVEENKALILQKDETSDQNGEMIHYSKLLINPNRYRLTIVI
ncbi:MAG: GntR family transcriptional regulator [Clostridiales bacterium]|nr:GntR family transcriptional regulator [Clostridiales bacterium]